jgi:hypothetical protein
MTNKGNKSLHLLLSKWSLLPKQLVARDMEINVRENRRGNHVWTIQRYRQHWLHTERRQTQQKHHTGS